MNKKNQTENAGRTLKFWAHFDALAAGWWDGHESRMNHGRFELIAVDEVVPTKLCLIHSEISEAMEAHRKNLMDDHLPHRPGIEVELADAVIRIMDLAGALDLDIGGAIAEKMAFNAERADHKPEARSTKHGKKY